MGLNLALSMVVVLPQACPFLVLARSLFSDLPSAGREGKSWARGTTVRGSFPLSGELQS